jgi:putative ABC transport system permease protein
MREDSRSAGNCSGSKTSPPDLRYAFRLVAREVGLLVGAGTIAGAGLAVAAARMLSQVLLPTASIAPSMLAASAGVMLVITILAACVPAIRACRVDPLAALRHE